LAGNKVLCFLYPLSILISGLGAWGVSRVGESTGFIDCPNERSSHCAPTPKGGGIGILAAFLISCWVLGMPVGFWLPAGALSIMGLAGDRLEISPMRRLMIQFVMAVLFLVTTSAAQGPSSGWMGKALLIPLLVVYVVGTANFYNFMDGINGIAGLTGVVGFGLMGVFVLSVTGKEQYALLSFSLASGCLGFLPFNLRRKAKVFMGDVGSILLGFVFAAMTVMIAQSWMDWLCLTGFLFPFYVDELTTMAVRLKDREKLAHAHRRHLYQILANERGIEHWKVSVGYGALQLGGGILLSAVRPFGLGAVLLTLGGMFAGFAAVSVLVRRTR
jgi:Fuc2NAc and GlcNAc transferase